MAEHIPPKNSAGSPPHLPLSAPGPRSRRVTAGSPLSAPGPSSRRVTVGSLLLLAALLCLPLLFSCTILDNDLRPESEKQAAAAPDTTQVIHEQTDEYTATYQYSNQTRVLDEQFLSYVAGIDYSLGALYLEDYTPDALLPVAGQILAGPICDQLPYGLSHHVVAVTHQNTLYEVRIKRAYIDEVFAHLELNGEFGEIADSVATDSTANDAPMPLPTRGLYDNEFKISTIESRQTIDLGMTWGGDNAVQLTGTGTLSLGVKIDPIFKVYAYINTDKSIYDIKATAGAVATFFIEGTATGTLTLDVLEFLKIKHLLKINVPVGEVAGVPFFVTFNPECLVTASISGTVGYQVTKTYYIDVRATLNAPGQTDGVHFNRIDKPIQFAEAMPEAKKETYASASLEAGLTFGGSVDLNLSALGEEPMTGLKFTLGAGPNLKTQIANTEEPDYNDSWHFGIPLTLSGKVYIDLFKKFPPLEVDVVKYLTGLWGGSNTLWEFAKKDFRFYPSIDNMRIVCANNTESGSVPQFNVDFDVLENGTKTGDNIGFRPVFRIFPHNVTSYEPIEEYDPFQYSTYRKGLHYNFPIVSSKLSRDEVYDLEVAMVKPGLYGENVMYRRKFPFTSTSPTAFINDWKKTAQWEHQCKQKRNGGYTCYYDYDFITVLHFEGREKIKEFGFLVNGKKYEIKNPPVKDDIAVKWSIVKSKKSKRDIKLTPYVVYELDGERYTTNMAPYTVSLTYEKNLNTVWNEWEGRIYQDAKDYDDYARSGFDINYENKADVDFETK